MRRAIPQGYYFNLSYGISSLKTGVKGDLVPFKSLLRHSFAVADGGILGATAPNPPLLASAYPSPGVFLLFLIQKLAMFIYAEKGKEACIYTRAMSQHVSGKDL